MEIHQIDLSNTAGICAVCVWERFPLNVSDTRRVFLLLNTFYYLLCFCCDMIHTVGKFQFLNISNMEMLLLSAEMKSPMMTSVTHFSQCCHFLFQELHVSQGALDSSVDMDRLKRNMPECGRQTHQVLQVSVSAWCVWGGGGKELLIVRTHIRTSLLLAAKTCHQSYLFPVLTHTQNELFFSW